MREWFKVFYALYKDAWAKHSKQSAFEKGACSLAYCVELNIRSGDIQPAPN